MDSLLQIPTKRLNMQLKALNKYLNDLNDQYDEISEKLFYEIKTEILNLPPQYDFVFTPENHATKKGFKLFGYNLSFSKNNSTVFYALVCLKPKKIDIDFDDRDDFLKDITSDDVLFTITKYIDDNLKKVSKEIEKVWRQIQQIKNLII